MHDLATIFEELVNQVQLWFPGFDAKLTVASPTLFPEKRDYAMCSDQSEIFVAPKMGVATQSRVLAVLMHELGHALDFQYRHEDLESVLGELPMTAERKADAIAEVVFDVTISYDRDLVQTLRSGTRPRPRKLGL